MKESEKIYRIETVVNSEGKTAQKAVCINDVK